MDKIKSMYVCANAECLHMHAHESCLSLSLHTSVACVYITRPTEQGQDATCSA